MRTGGRYEIDPATGQPQLVERTQSAEETLAPQTPPNTEEMTHGAEESQTGPAGQD